MADVRRTGSPSRLLFHWRAADTSLDALTGHAGTFARMSPGEATDSTGVAYRVANNVPCWQWTSDAPGLLIRPLEEDALGAGIDREAESLVYPYNGRIVAHAGYLRFVERGAIAASASIDALLLHLGASSAADPRFLVRAVSGQYQARFNSPTVTSSSMTGSAPVEGQLVELRWSLKPDGRVQIHQTIQAGTETSAAESGTNATPPPVTPSGPQLHLGGRTTVNIGGVQLLAVKLHPDYNATLAELRVAF